MEGLNKSQLVLLVLLVSFVTSLSTVAVTLSLLKEETPTGGTQTVLQRLVQNARDEEGASKSSDVVVVHDEDMVVNVVEKASPAVVSIVATKDLPVVRRYFMDPFGGGDFFEDFFFGMPQRRFNAPEDGKTEPQEIGRGSGFLVSADGYIVTNRHVVTDTEAEYTVIRNTGETYKADVLARDPVHDIAILRIEGTDLPFIPLKKPEAVRIGQTVIAIGNALGEFQNTVSVGVVSGTGRTIIAGADGGGGASELRQVIQTDAAINPGNSGGPLMNSKGEVIGVNTAMVAGAENIGFAIPAHFVIRDLEQVQKQGKIVYPYLGVRYIVITDALQKAKNLALSEGVLITGSEDGREPAVVPHSPAQKAGLREGDIIVKIDDVTLNKDNSLAEHIQMKNIGDSAALTIRRGTETLSVNVLLGERP